MSHLDDVLNRTGLTYRQLDYWTRTGRLACHGGFNHEWPEGEITVAAIMGRLIAAGFTLQGAHDAARKIVSGQSQIAPGINVEVWDAA